MPIQKKISDRYELTEVQCFARLIMGRLLVVALPDDAPLDDVHAYIVNESHIADGGIDIPHDVVLRSGLADVMGLDAA